jgi:hypothetical protein
MQDSSCLHTDFCSWLVRSWTRNSYSRLDGSGGVTDFDWHLLHYFGPFGFPAHYVPRFNHFHFLGRLAGRRRPRRQMRQLRR